MKWKTWFGGLADIVTGYGCTVIVAQALKMDHPWHVSLCITGAVVCLVRGAVRQVNSRRE